MNTLELPADSGTPFLLTINNTSSTATALSVHAELPESWSDVVQNADDCATLEPGGQCTLFFTSGSTTHPATVINIVGENAEPFPVTFTITAPLAAVISVAGMPLTLEAGSGITSPINITNLSATLTATNIVADLSGSPLQNAVTQDAGDCASVAPGATCALLITPQNTAVTLTNFPIQGDNTTQAAGAIVITLPATATLTADGSPLLLQATNGTPASGALTITNTSTSVTATNVSANIAGTALAGLLTQDASNCASVAPGATCTLSFTPASTAAAATPVVVQGDNTSQVGASIAINAAPQPLLSITGSPLTLIFDGPADSLTVTNQSSTETAVNIVSSFNGTALAGNVAETGNTCASVAPGASCTLTFTPGSNVVPQTTFPIAGTNTQTATADLRIRGLQIGDNFAGGIVFLVPSGGLPGKVASTAQGAVPWDDNPTPPFVSIGVSAQSITDGAANTAAIVATLGARTTYAAGYCDAYSIVIGGVTYDDWYLPANNELTALLEQTTFAPSPGPIAGFNAAYYWSSTEHNFANARLFAPSAPATFNFDTKGRTTWGTRCIRTFN
jgi:hypothetical protein